MQSLAERVRANLPLIEDKMLGMEQAECPVYHRFGPGIYIRELQMRAGTFAIGHYQKTQHVNIMLAGRVTMLNEDGTTTEAVAPLFYVGDPGRKVGYVHEDMVWMNVYPTQETDIEKLEAMFLDKSSTFQEYTRAEEFVRFVDREDYKAMLAEYGWTEEQVRAITEDTSDAIELPPGSYKFRVADSPIQGKGLFATAEILKGEDIAPARLGTKRTLAGRFTNHAKEPNAIMVLLDGGGFILQAIKNIEGQRGGQLGEEITVDYRQVLQLHEVES